MTDMPLNPTWQDIALRLALTMVASAIIGLNRGARGHAAGLRTTTLVGLAAAVAMIQANLLLSLTGKAPTSFIQLDVMRLPLGILTGVGFIGGGTILRRGDLVTGVTTAATLWVVTVIGLCFGSGEIELGGSAALLAVITLLGLRWVDLRIPRKQSALLAIQGSLTHPPGTELAELLAPAGYKTQFRGLQANAGGEHAEFSFEISWRRAEISDAPLDLLKLIGGRHPIVCFRMISEAHR